MGPHWITPASSFGQSASLNCPKARRIISRVKVQQASRLLFGVGGEFESTTNHLAC